MRNCNKKECKQQNPQNDSEFVKGSNRWCRACRIEYRQKYAKENKQYLKEYRKQHNLKPETKKKKSIISRKLTLLQYGLNEQNYNDLLNKQDFRCKICNKPHSSDKKLVVDHNHTTRKSKRITLQLL